jgi:hypothetical protein
MKPMFLLKEGKGGKKMLLQIETKVTLNHPTSKKNFLPRKLLKSYYTLIPYAPPKQYFKKIVI